MKDLLKNKRIIFPIIICLVVIVIAICIFIILGLDTGDNQRVSNIDLSGTAADNSSGTNVTNTENTTDGDDDNDNNVKNETDGDDDKDNRVKNETGDDTDNEVKNKIGDDDDGDDDGEDVEFGGEQFYLDSVNDFVKGLMNADEMRNFVDNHLDVQAYIACYNVEGDDSKFMDEYNSLELDDNTMKDVIDKFADIATEKDVKLTALTDPRQSGDSEAINRVTMTVKSGDKTKKIRMVFYQDVVIYIYDENGDPLIDLD